MILSLLFTSFAFYTGLLICLFYILFPYLYSYFKKPEGFEWVPVNNQHRHPGDNRIYASCVQEARLNFFKYRHPCSPRVGNMAVDFTRVTSYRTAALFGLFIPDERIAFLLSISVSVILQYILVFFISLIMFQNQWIALSVAMLTIFWFKTMVYLDSERGVKSVLEYIKTNILNENRTAFFDIVNDNFRYVIMSVAGIYTWATFLILLYLPEFNSVYLTFSVFTVYFLLIPFVYPPTSFISILIIGSGILIHSYNSGKYSMLIVVIVSAFVAFILLALSGLFSRIKDIRASNMDVLNSSHGTKETYKIISIDLWHRLLKKKLFFIPLACLPVFFFVKTAFTFIPVTLAVFVVLKSAAYFLHKNSIIYRFTIRGGVHYLFFAIVCTGIIVLQQVNGLPLTGIFMTASVLLAAIPLLGCLRMAESLFNAKAYFMPVEEWEMYRFIKKNTPPRSEIMAYSFSNMQLLPVYTHANLYVTGAEWLENPEKELTKYIAALKLINIGSDQFLKKFNNFFLRPAVFLPEPGNEADMKDHHLVTTLIYFPFVQQINGIKLAMENGKEWTAEFLAYVKNKFTGTESASFIKNINYILIDNQEWDKAEGSPQGFQEIFKNKRFILFGK